MSVNILLSGQIGITEFQDVGVVTRRLPNIFRCKIVK